MATKRRVRFEDHVDVRIVTTIVEAHQREDQTDTFWYVNEEYSLIRKVALLMSMHARARGISDILPENGVMRQKTVQRALNHWSCMVSVRGLERLCNKDHGEWRERERQQAIRAVLLAQKTTNQSPNDQDAKDQLARISEIFTRNAKRFAVMMGAADAYAARVELEDLGMAENVSVDVNDPASTRVGACVSQETSEDPEVELFPSAA